MSSRSLHLGIEHCDPSNTMFTVGTLKEHLLVGADGAAVAGAAVSHLKLSAREAFWVSGATIYNGH